MCSHGLSIAASLRSWKPYSWEASSSQQRKQTGKPKQGEEQSKDEPEAVVVPVTKVKAITKTTRKTRTINAIAFTVSKYHQSDLFICKEQIMEPDNSLRDESLSQVISFRTTVYMHGLDNCRIKPSLIFDLIAVSEDVSALSISGMKTRSLRLNITVTILWRTTIVVWWWSDSCAWMESRNRFSNTPCFSLYSTRGACNPQSTDAQAEKAWKMAPGWCATSTCFWIFKAQYCLSISFKKECNDKFIPTLIAYIVKNMTCFALVRKMSVLSHYRYILNTKVFFKDVVVPALVKNRNGDKSGSNGLKISHLDYVAMPTETTEEQLKIIRAACTFMGSLSSIFLSNRPSSTKGLKSFLQELRLFLLSTLQSIAGCLLIWWMRRHRIQRPKELQFCTFFGWMRQHKYHSGNQYAAPKARYERG